jgi:hypothetical protein
MKSNDVEKPNQYLLQRTANFLAAATKAHEGKYDYSLVEYKHAYVKVMIICPLHGKFEQLPLNHQRGVGCPSCKIDTLRRAFSGNIKAWLEKVKAFHGERYDYAKAVYKGVDTLLTITCRVHGDFAQTPWNHQIGKGCPKCRYITIGDKTRGNLIKFEINARKIHGDKYDYSQGVYKSNYTSIKIICPIHGAFNQHPSNHLAGKACSKCSQRKPKVEIEISEYLTSLGAVFLENDRQAIKPLELDFYFPAQNLAIEFCGMYWHSEERVGQNYHRNKWQTCHDKNIRLLQIFEDEWAFRKEAVKTLIKGALNCMDSVAARKTTAHFELPISPETKQFIKENHHSGHTQAACAVVLKEGEKIVFAASFRRYSQNRKTFIEGEWELARVTSSKRVQGGLSKALTAFKENMPAVVNLYSFCDLRYFNGHGLEKVGFEYMSTTAPTPFYAKRLERVHQRKFTKAKAIAAFGSGYKTAREAVCSNGWWRIFDCGHKKYRLKVELNRLNEALRKSPELSERSDEDREWQEAPPVGREKI